MADDFKMNLSNSENEGNFNHIGVHEKKYFALKKRCEQLQQSNEKLVNRLHHVKRLVRKYRRDRKLLMNRLDEVGDDFRDAPMASLYEEGELTGIVGPGTGDFMGSAGCIPFYHHHSPSPNKPHIPAPIVVKTEAASPSTSAAHHSTSSASSLSPYHLASPSTIKGKKIKKEDISSQVPKKPANAFLMFCQRQKDVVQQLHRQEHGEDMSHQDLTKQLALQWNSLPVEKKKVYFDLHEQELERYERSTKQYIKTSPDKKSAIQAMQARNEQELDSAIDSITM